MEFSFCSSLIHSPGACVRENFLACFVCQLEASIPSPWRSSISRSSRLIKQDVNLNTKTDDKVKHFSSRTVSDVSEKSFTRKKILHDDVCSLKPRVLKGKAIRTYFFYEKRNAAKTLRERARNVRKVKKKKKRKTLELLNVTLFREILAVPANLRIFHACQ